MNLSLPPDDRYRHHIEVATEVHLPDEPDPTPALGNWLTETKATARFCHHHPQTLLEFVVGSEGFHVFAPVPRICPLKLSEALDDGPEWTAAWQRKIAALPPGPPPPTHRFYAGLRCPACVVGRARFPREFHQTSFADFETSTPDLAKSLKLCREFATQVAQQHRGFLVMVGRPGTGKTRLAANIVRELPHLPALYCRQQEATNELRATYGHREITFNHHPFRGDGDEAPPSAPAILTRLQSAKLLILDELFCAAPGKDEVTLLDEVLKHRFDHHLPTILLSNLAFANSDTKQGFMDSLGHALASRIALAAGNSRFLLTLKGPDYRSSGALDYLRAP